MLCVLKMQVSQNGLLVTAENAARNEATSAFHCEENVFSVDFALNEHLHAVHHIPYPRISKFINISSLGK